MVNKDIYYTQETCLTEDKVNLSDSELFLAVMKNKIAQECMLSIIMNEPDLKLKSVNVEEVIPNKKGKKMIRLDAYAEDDRGRIIDTEMQNDTGHDSIPKRVRYYIGRLDASLLFAGQKYPYKELPELVVIFITPKDLFGKDHARYEFRSRCTELKDLEINDGLRKLFLNMESLEGDPVLVSLLQYMKDSRITNPKIIVKDTRIQKLDEIVQEVKDSNEWRELLVSLEERMEVRITKQIEDRVTKQVTEHEKQKSAVAFIAICADFNQTRDTTRKKMIEKLKVTEEEADRYLDEFWEEDQVSGS